MLYETRWNSFLWAETIATWQPVSALLRTFPRCGENPGARGIRGIPRDSSSVCPRPRMDRRLPRRFPRICQRSTMKIKALAALARRWQNTVLVDANHACLGDCLELFRVIQSYKALFFGCSENSDEFTQHVQEKAEGLAGNQQISNPDELWRPHWFMLPWHAMTRCVSDSAKPRCFLRAFMDARMPHAVSATWLINLLRSSDRKSGCGMSSKRRCRRSFRWRTWQAKRIQTKDLVMMALMAFFQGNSLLLKFHPRCSGFSWLVDAVKACERSWKTNKLSECCFWFYTLRCTMGTMETNNRYLVSNQFGRPKKC